MGIFFFVESTFTLSNHFGMIRTGFFGGGGGGSEDVSSLISIGLVGSAGFSGGVGL